jgi:hypothetical protein
MCFWRTGSPSSAWLKISPKRRWTRVCLRATESTAFPVRAVELRPMPAPRRRYAETIAQMSRILRVEAPEPGRWNVRLTGTGLYVLSVLAKTPITFGNVRESPSTLPGLQWPNGFARSARNRNPGRGR